MTSSRRRRVALPLAGLVLFQSLFMAVGACAQMHAGADGAGHASADAHVHAQAQQHPEDGDDAPVTDCCGTEMAEGATRAGAPSGPTDCAALSGCSVPALGVDFGSAPSWSNDRTVAAARSPRSGPIAADLTISTPPPKGL